MSSVFSKSKGMWFGVWFCFFGGEGLGGTNERGFLNNNAFENILPHIQLAFFYVKCFVSKCFIYRTSEIKGYCLYITFPQGFIFTRKLYLVYIYEVFSFIIFVSEVLNKIFVQFCFNFTYSFLQMDSIEVSTMRSKSHLRVLK